MSNKRTLTEFITENENNNNPPTKRRKLSTPKPDIPQSSLFNNVDDYNEYQLIYQTLTNINNINITPLISKHISEYAVGNSIKCDNHKNCGNKVIMLNADKSISNDKRDFLLQ